MIYVGDWSIAPLSVTPWIFVSPFRAPPVACQPGDLLCSGVPEALLENAIVSAGASEIDMKVRDDYKEKYEIER